MSVRKSLASSVVMWAALGGLARADAIMGTSSSDQWHVWVFNRGVVERDVPFASSISHGDAETVSAPSPAPTPTPAPTPIPAPAAGAKMLAAPSGVQAAASTSGSGGPADAYINFNGPYPELSSLTTGSAQPWYDSPVVKTVFGGTPTLAQQTDFINQVFQDIQTTYQSSGINARLTLDPNVPAARTLSVVSGVHYDPIPGAIGITDVGHSGFSFIDNFSDARPGQVDQFAWAVAHNISHELMHAFGVAVHHDQTGNYLDAGSASWTLLTDPDTRFSQAAVDDINTHLIGTAGQSGIGAEQIDGDQVLVQPVPEPATIALWGLGAVAIVALRHRAA
ncbi:MAG TPA: PEP-CTERM sorting domain-containing protein [Isosphaeraceae bacterium]|nr:PEP-CTERM sorting domain-containing protein [Isosphaeraceae bacterium]